MGCVGSSNPNSVGAPVQAQRPKQIDNTASPRTVEPVKQGQVRPKELAPQIVRPTLKQEPVDDPKKSISPATVPAMNNKYQPTPTPPQAFIIPKNGQNSSRNNLNPKTDRNVPELNQQKLSVSPSSLEALTLSKVSMQLEDRAQITPNLKSLTFDRITPKEWNEVVQDVRRRTDGNLVELRMIDSAFGDDGIAGAAEMPNLKKFWMINGRHTAKSLQSVLKMHGLVELKLEDNTADPPLPRLTVEYFKQVATRLKNLEELTITIPWVTELSMNGINADGSNKLTAKHCRFIASSLKNLKKLDISNFSHNEDNNKIGPDGIKHLVAGLKTLEQLNISGNQLGDNGVAQLASFSKLTKLDISNNGITPARLADLRARLPTTTIII